mgnify:CR=1 FL=1
MEQDEMEKIMRIIAQQTENYNGLNLDASIYYNDYGYIIVSVVCDKYRIGSQITIPSEYTEGVSLKYTSSGLGDIIDLSRRGATMVTKELIDNLLTMRKLK